MAVLLNGCRLVLAAICQNCRQLCSLTDAFWVAGRFASPLNYLSPRNDARAGGSSPTRSSTSPVRLPSSSPTRRPSSSPIRNPSDSSWRNSTSSNYAKLSASSSTSATGSSWQTRTNSSSFSASKAIDSSDSYSFSSKAADSSYGSWGRNSGRGTSSSPKSSFSTSRSPGSGRIGLSALKWVER